MESLVHINKVPFSRSRFIMALTFLLMLCIIVVWQLSRQYGGWLETHEKFAPVLIIELMPVLFVTLLFFLSRGELISQKITDARKEREDLVRAVSSTIDKIKTGEFNMQTDKTGEEIVDLALNNIYEKFKADAESERNRSWMNEGIALFRQIMSGHTQIKSMCDQLVSTMVKYVKANQGGIFIVNDDRRLELFAAYAFERKKYLQKTLEPGEGLVGQCYLEGHRIYLKKVPQGYVHITSGLGAGDPDCILIFPLKIKDEIVGVVELASFRVFQEHELEFLEKSAEAIAQSILSIKASEQTQALLDKSLSREKEMKHQEELMRQSMEELYVTQEDMRKINLEMEEIFKAINTLTATVEINRNSEIIKLNDRFLHTLAYTAQDVYGKPFQKFLTAEADGAPLFSSLWPDVLGGAAPEKVFSFVDRAGKTRWLRTGFYPLQGTQGTERILCFLNDITEIKLKETELDKLNHEVEAFRKMLIRILNQIPLKVFLKQYNGKFFIVNDAVSSFHGFKTPDGLIGKSDFDFYDAKDAAEWLEAEHKIIAGGRTEYTHEDNGRILRTVKMPFYIDPLKETGLLGFQADVTELETLKKELQRENGNFK
jgi:PAS domain S-box-containing protein